MWQSPFFLEQMTESVSLDRKVTLYQQDISPVCSNPKCVSIQDTEIKYLRPEFKIVNTQPLTLRCVYCEHGFEPGYVASSDWHEGKLDTRKYHSAVKSARSNTARARMR